MKISRINAMVVGCLTATAGLVTAGSLVLSAPATGVAGPCATAAGGSTGSANVLPSGAETQPAGPCAGATTATTTPGEPPEQCVIETGNPDCVPGGGVAVDGSVVSGNGVAVHGSTASGCSTAVDKSTASGGDCAANKKVTPSSPARAVRANPSFAG